MKDEDIQAQIDYWTEAELEELATRVWSAVEYHGTGSVILRNVIHEVMR